jgi:dephospho-CoA kinase
MGQIIIVCGPPGAGKSSYGKKLAAERKAALLDLDTATERLIRLALSESGHDPDDRDSEYFKETFREPLYETLFDTARENAAWTDVVIIGPFTREIKDPSWPDKLGDALSAPVAVHYVTCEAQIRRQRLLHRGNPRDAAKLKNWEEFLRYYGDDSLPVFPHVLVNTTPDA